MKTLLLVSLLVFSAPSFAGWFSNDNYLKHIAPQQAVESREERDNAFVRRCDSQMDKFEYLMYENPDDEYYEYQYNLWEEKCEKYYQ